VNVNPLKLGWSDVMVKLLVGAVSVKVLPSVRVTCTV
jgi:hypothetical protein